MFTRSSDGHVPEAHTQQPTSVHMSPASQSPVDPIGGEPSIISRDLTIAGARIKISSKAPLRVDGTIEGDVSGVQIAIGPHGLVQGTITAERVDVLGRVIGAIQGEQVTLRSGAKVNGDIHHQSLIIEMGATFDGRAARSDVSTKLANATGHSAFQRETAA